MFHIKDYVAAYKFNKNCKDIDAKRDAGLTVPADIDVFKNLSYGPNGKANLLDVYRPKGSKERLPVLVSIHGGGYVYGDKELYSYYTMMFASAGFAVVNFNYTLCPKCKFPAITFETNEVMKWIVSNQEEYGLDTGNIVMVGDSAGAQLVSQYALVTSNKEYAKVMGIDVPEINVKAISLGCGFYKIDEIDKNSSDFERAYFNWNSSQYASKVKVLDYIDKNYPPTFVFSCPGDFLYEHLEPMASLLEERGIDTIKRVYGDNETYHVFFLDIRSELAKQANEDQITFLKNHIN